MHTGMGPLICGCLPRSPQQKHTCLPRNSIASASLTDVTRTSQLRKTFGHTLHLVLAALLVLYLTQRSRMEDPLPQQDSGPLPC